MTVVLKPKNPSERHLYHQMTNQYQITVRHQFIDFVRKKIAMLDYVYGKSIRSLSKNRFECRLTFISKFFSVETFRCEISASKCFVVHTAMQSACCIYKCSKSPERNSRPCANVTKVIRRSVCLLFELIHVRCSYHT